MGGTDSTPPRLVISALRAHLGDWVYYVGFLKLADVAARVRFAEEVHRSEALRQLIQRRLTKRSGDISNYLLHQKQRFFNALVIGVYEGDPKWHELSIRGSKLAEPASIPSQLEGTLGFLVLEGDERLFALDGQHRVAGIRRAVEARPDLGDEEVAALFVAHKQGARGLERTRRLFTTLNRYAKPVSKKDIIALDEDDAVAITTRRLVEDHPLFHEKVSLRQPRHISASDTSSFTTVVALYDATDMILRPSEGRHAKTFKRLRPSDRDLEAHYKRVTDFWRLVASTFPAIREAQRRRPGRGVVAGFRSPEGGHLLFRPAGLLIFVRVVRRFTDHGASAADAVNRLSRVPMELAHAPWEGLLWDATNRRMITEGANQRVAEKVLLYSIGGDLSWWRGESVGDLRRELAGRLNRSEEQVELPRFV